MTQSVIEGKNQKTNMSVCDIPLLLLLLLLFLYKLFLCCYDGIFVLVLYFDVSLKCLCLFSDMI